MDGDDWCQWRERWGHTVRHFLKEPHFLLGDLEPWIWPLNPMYNGHTNNGKAEGHGVFIYPDFSKAFYGIYRGGKRHGQGTTIFTPLDDDYWDNAFAGPNNPTRIERTYVDGKPSDRGRICWWDNWYEGEMKGDKMHGHGFGVRGDGSRMAGEFEDGKMHGWGFSWEGVEGEWEDDVLIRECEVPCSECKSLLELACSIEPGSGRT